MFAGVVAEFDEGDDGGADGGDGVGEDDGDVVDEDALGHEEDGACPKGEEGGHGYAIGVAGADGAHGLRQVAANHAD